MTIQARKLETSTWSFVSEKVLQILPSTEIIKPNPAVNTNRRWVGDMYSVVLKYVG
jgi:hypothetical protein